MIHKGDTRLAFSVGNVRVSEIYKGAELVYSASQLVTYNIDTNNVKTEKIKYGQSSASPTTFTPTKSGWEFVGWRTDSVVNSSVIKVGTANDVIVKNKPITLYAVFKKLVTKTFISYDGSSYTSEPVTAYRYYNNGKTVNPDMKSPTGKVREGWTWRGWSPMDSEEANPSYGIFNNETTLTGCTQDGTYYGLYKKTVTITYRGNSSTSGSVDAESKTRYWSACKKYKNPTFTIKSNGFSRTGYSFANWGTSTSGGTIYTAGQTDVEFTASDTLYAQWSANDYKYNIVYKSSSGVQLGTATITKKYGTTNTVSPKSYTGYTSPSSQSVKWDSTTAKTITFTYTPITYTITYNLNSGSITGQKTTYTIESADFTLVTPTRNYYDFTGWTGTDLSSATKSVKVTKGSTGNRTYTANWSAKSYTITYNLKGGTNPSGAKTSYKITDATFSLPTPSRTLVITNDAGLSNVSCTCTFEGWYDSSGNKVTQIAKGSHGNKTYTAKWSFSKDVSLKKLEDKTTNDKVKSPNYTINTDGFQRIDVTIKMNGDYGYFWISCGNVLSGSNAHDSAINRLKESVKSIKGNQGNFKLNYAISMNSSGTWCEAQVIKLVGVA